MGFVGIKNNIEYHQPNFLKLKHTTAKMQKIPLPKHIGNEMSVLVILVCKSRISFESVTLRIKQMLISSTREIILYQEDWANTQCGTP